MGGTLQVVPVLFNAPSLGFKQAKTKGRYRQGGTGKNQQDERVSPIFMPFWNLTTVFEFKDATKDFLTL
jgi:hypothetical protein